MHGVCLGAVPRPGTSLYAPLPNTAGTLDIFACSRRTITQRPDTEGHVVYLAKSANRRQDAP